MSIPTRRNESSSLSREELDRRLDHALEETFPASDPVSIVIARHPDPEPGPDGARDTGRGRVPDTGPDGTEGTGVDGGAGRTRDPGPDGTGGAAPDKAPDREREK